MRKFDCNSFRITGNTKFMSKTIINHTCKDVTIKLEPISDSQALSHLASR